ncbi:hypothetical protein LCGC14_2063140 [marine sediment metagenome]|uniref:Uncharacterized protein n=1 Tax=marine sediment metagenome TaxID=412755 RepID=A0A0F9EKQ0_9ZZZZ
MADANQATVSGLSHFPKNATHDVTTSAFRSQFISQIEPKYAELARARVLYAANNGSAAGLGDVEAIPTTTATYALYNNSDTKHLVVLKIGAIVTDVTPALGWGLIAGLSPTAQASAETKYANSLALAITPGSPDPGGYLTDAVTLAGTPLWMTLGSSNGTLLGTSITAWVDGLFIVPPKFALGIDIVGSVGSTPLYDVDILWAELELELG